MVLNDPWNNIFVRPKEGTVMTTYDKYFNGLISLQHSTGRTNINKTDRKSDMIVLTTFNQFKIKSAIIQLAHFTQSSSILCGYQIHMYILDTAH